MEGELTGRVAVILPERPEWEEAPGPVPVLIGRFHKATKLTEAHYDADSPYLAHHAPELAVKLGSS